MEPIAAHRSKSRAVRTWAVRRGPAVSIPVRCGRATLVCALLLGLAAPASAGAAAGGSPAPRPQPAPVTAGTHGPSPDPEIQRTTTTGTGSASSPAPASVTPSPPASASPAPAQPTATNPITTAPAGGSELNASPPTVHHAAGAAAHRRAASKRRAVRVHRPTRSEARRSSPLVGRRELPGAPSRASVGSAARRDGVLMLLAALALGVLVIASSSMLQLLKRLHRHSYQGPAA